MRTGTSLQNQLGDLWVVTGELQGTPELLHSVASSVASSGAWPWGLAMHCHLLSANVQQAQQYQLHYTVSAQSHQPSSCSMSLCFQSSRGGRLCLNCQNEVDTEIWYLASTVCRNSLPQSSFRHNRLDYWKDIGQNGGHLSHLKCTGHTTCLVKTNNSFISI